MSVRSEAADFLAFPRPYGVEEADRRRAARANVDRVPPASLDLTAHERALLAEHEAHEAERRQLLATVTPAAPLNLYFTSPSWTMGEILGAVETLHAAGIRCAPAWVRDERGDPVGLHLIGTAR